jgi:hypothetical protein
MKSSRVVCTYISDVLLQSGNAERSDDEPNLQGTESPDGGCCSLEEEWSFFSRTNGVRTMDELDDGCELMATVADDLPAERYLPVLHTRFSFA